MCGDQVLCIGLALRTVDLFHLLEVHIDQIVGSDALVEAVLTENAVDTGLVQSDLCDFRTGLQLRGDVLADGLAAGFVIRADERQILAGIRTDIADDHRHVRLLSQRQDRGAGSRVRGGDHDRIHLLRDGVLCVGHLRICIVLGIIGHALNAVLGQLILHAVADISPERHIQRGRQIGDLCRRSVAAAVGAVRGVCRAVAAAAAGQRTTNHQGAEQDRESLLFHVHFLLN